MHRRIVGIVFSCLLMAVINCWLYYVVRCWGSIERAAVQTSRKPSHCPRAQVPHQYESSSVGSTGEWLPAAWQTTKTIEIQMFLIVFRSFWDVSSGLKGGSRGFKEGSSAFKVFLLFFSPRPLFHQNQQLYIALCQQGSQTADTGRSHDKFAPLALLLALLSLMTYATDIDVWMSMSKSPEDSWSSDEFLMCVVILSASIATSGRHRCWLGRPAGPFGAIFRNRQDPRGPQESRQAECLDLKPALSKVQKVHERLQGDFG